MNKGYNFKNLAGKGINLCQSKLLGPLLAKCPNFGQNLHTKKIVFITSQKNLHPPTTRDAEAEAGPKL